MATVRFARGGTAGRKRPSGVGSDAYVIGNVDPVRDFVGGRVDDGDARCVFIMREHARAIGRDGDALHRLGHWNSCNDLAIGDVEED
jgi:hypothetical protein